MSFTTSFVDDVMFLHNGTNGPESLMTHMFFPVHQVVSPVVVWSSLPGGCTVGEVCHL